MLPRGWLKTTLCTIAFPMWLSIGNPNIRTLIVQNTHPNACKKLSVIMNQWETNPILRAMFPELLPGKTSTWRGDSACLTRTASFPESTYEAAGTNTKVISRHYDVIIEDDTVAPDLDELGGESLAPTHDDVQKAIGWHRTNSLPLLNNPSKDLVLVVGTRWYDQDLLRWIQDNEPQYKVITRACREDDEGEPSASGEITYPERFDEEVLAGLEAALGPYMFSCLYLNMPVRSEDMLFKSEWFEYYENMPPRQSLDVYTTVDVATDPALAKSKDIDFNVVMTCGKDLVTGIIYVLDYFCARCSPGELAGAIFDHVVRFRPNVVGYEDVAYQRSLDYWLKELMCKNQLYFCLEPLKRGNRKNAKGFAIAGLQPVFHSKSIRLRNHMKELISQLLKFPLGSHDDIADALSMQLTLWRRTKSKKNPLEVDYGNPLSFEHAVLELRNRRGLRFSGPVFDPLRCASTLENHG